MQYVNEFISARKLDGLVAGTLYQYRLKLGKLFQYLNKSTLEATITDLRNYLTQFSAMAQRSINRKISTIKAFYVWLVEEEYLERNPTRKIKTPKEPATLPRNLSKEDLDLLRWHPKSDRNQAIMELLVSSGMRVGELVKLNRDDIDMTNRKIRVVGKGNKERIVFFAQTAKFCLKKYLMIRKDDNPALLINKYGKRLSIRSIEMQIKDEAGCDIDFLSKLLGHESTDTTRRYTHISGDQMARMYDKFAS